MSEQIKYPRVLLVALGRINASDTSNNGLLLRNILGSSLPRENLAQIYSSGDNGDVGLFKHYYRINDCDRTFGSLFYRFKDKALNELSIVSADASISAPAGIISKLKSYARRLFVNTGVYELIFRPRVSKRMMQWVNEFQPDIIFAQGYNLTFTWLPVLLKETTGAKLAFLTTDDWPTYLYSGQLGEPKLFRWLVRPFVESATRRLLAEVDIPFAFGQPMAKEYSSRYKKNFLVLNHADNQYRFDNAELHRIYPTNVISIIAIGTYNRFRWPLLLDVNDACQELLSQGINVRLTVLTSSIEDEGVRALSLATHVDLLPDPGNDLLPAYLKGADILLLVEGFDEDFVSAIKFSISSKAHLYMFSHIPIIAYSHPETGVATYARSFNWAKLVTKQNKQDLKEAIQQLVEDENMVKCLVAKADDVASKFHTHSANREVLLRGLASIKTNIKDGA